MRAAQVEKQDVMTSPVTFVKAVTKQKLGSRRYITSGTYTADGRLVMTDYGNNLVVELDGEYNIVKEYKIDGTPTDVAAGNQDNEIYIAVNYKYIMKCTLHTDLSYINKIEAPSRILSIARNGDFVVGTLNAVILLSQNRSKVKSFHKPIGSIYIAVSRTQRSLYYRDNDDVVCQTWKGQEVFRYQHPQLRAPCGFDIDSEGNVYICGYSSHNLHIISSNGQRSIVIQLHNISRPYGVVVHPQKKELLVISCDDDVAFEVYRLS